MNMIILGLFHKAEDAENAINELSRNGISSKDISIIMKEEQIAKEIAKATGANNVAGGVATGATTGGILGGITGLLVGIGALTIPGVGALLIAGPMASALGLTGAAATTVSGALTGALAGGLVGGLIGLGLSEEEAKFYEADIKNGAILLGIPATDTSETIVRKILQDHHPEQIRSIIKK